MFTYRLTIAYDGTDFVGWQVQPSGLSIQGVIETLLAELIGTPLRVIGAGRTDAGVHAIGQVAHFRTEREWQENELKEALNRRLPETIRILSVERVAADFHAQYSATGKIYVYRCWLAREVDPFQHRYQLHVRYPLEITKLEAGARQLVGTHDFSTFANEPAQGSASRDPVRTLYRLEVQQEGPLLTMLFEGNGFLYKMVRNIVGTLLEVANGRRPVEQVEQLLAARDRRLGGQAAPPQGLSLIKVHY